MKNSSSHEPLSYTLVVLATPEASLRHLRGIAFARAVRAAGHSIGTIFFYGSGVQIGLPWAADIAEQWRDIADHDGLALTLCSASVERYGLPPVDAPWQVSGLGVLMEAGLSSQRVITLA